MWGGASLCILTGSNLGLPECLCAVRPGCKRGVVAGLKPTAVEKCLVWPMWMDLRIPVGFRCASVKLYLALRKTSVSPGLQ